MTRSIYAHALEELGLDEWSAEELSTHGFCPKAEDHIPCSFWILDINGLIVTFAYDELGTIWAGEGTIDLTNLGFQDIHEAETERPKIH